MAQTPYKQLEQEWKRLHAFRGAMAILRWDAAVMMPRGSADVRGEQLAALDGIEIEGARRTTRCFSVSSPESRRGDRITITLRANPDGSTLLFIPDFLFTVYPHSFRKLSYAPVADFAPVAIVAPKAIDTRTAGSIETLAMNHDCLMKSRHG